MALNQAASILLDNASTSLPAKAMEKERGHLVALLLKDEYEEAEEISSTLWE